MAILDFSLFVACSMALSWVVIAERKVVRRVRRPNGYRLAVAAGGVVGMVISGAILLLPVWSVGFPSLVLLLRLACLSILTAMVALTRQRWIDRKPADMARRILAVGAHPDDLELAAGGTGSSQKRVDQGSEPAGVEETAGDVVGQVSEPAGGTA